MFIHLFLQQTLSSPILYQPLGLTTETSLTRSLLGCCYWAEMGWDHGGQNTYIRSRLLQHAV